MPADSTGSSTGYSVRTRRRGVRRSGDRCPSTPRRSHGSAGWAAPTREWSSSCPPGRSCSTSAAPAATSPASSSHAERVAVDGLEPDLRDAEAARAVCRSVVVGSVEDAAVGRARRRCLRRDRARGRRRAPPPPGGGSPDSRCRSSRRAAASSSRCRTSRTTRCASGCSAGGSATRTSGCSIVRTFGSSPVRRCAELLDAVGLDPRPRRVHVPPSAHRPAVSRRSRPSAMRSHRGTRAITRRASGLLAYQFVVSALAATTGRATPGADAARQAID